MECDGSTFTDFRMEGAPWSTRRGAGALIMSSWGVPSVLADTKVKAFGEPCGSFDPGGRGSLFFGHSARKSMRTSASEA